MQNPWCPCDDTPQMAPQSGVHRAPRRLPGSTVRRWGCDERLHLVALSAGGHIDGAFSWELPAENLKDVWHFQIFWRKSEGFSL